MPKTKDQPDTTNALAVIDMSYDGNVFSADFKAMEKAARAYAKQFDNMQIVTDDDRKRAKDIRADINGRIKEINSARIALYKKYDEPKFDFTAMLSSQSSKNSPNTSMTGSSAKMRNSERRAKPCCRRSMRQRQKS